MTKTSTISFYLNLFACLCWLYNASFIFRISDPFIGVMWATLCLVAATFNGMVAWAKRPWAWHNQRNF